MCPPEPPFPLAKGIYGKRRTPNSLHPFSNDHATGLPEIPEANTAPEGVVKEGVKPEASVQAKGRRKKSRR